MPAEMGQEIELLCDALRRYLAKHPDAADSLEGICQWWLPETLRGTSPVLLQTAMEALVVTGEMRRVLLPDGSELYARADTNHPWQHD